ncbi:pentatricopeptide repeat-containing protein At2g15630, mitochondrial-like [Lotus japonicus]|uniref:pentatricopeptide repeat-containing protein At2g15630, mitochondrial-like n=1 Tax=Lotus japonicus TaxID=34305 RepID=UPI002589508A|nr:pentatricopeptide repeat-containing protein At2g15630, mitochondrial-like [Lotus japonicus]
MARGLAGIREKFLQLFTGNLFINDGDGTKIPNSISMKLGMEEGEVAYGATIWNPRPQLALPPPITNSTLLQAIDSSHRHFIEHFSLHLTPSILPLVLASFNLTARCLAFFTLYLLSHPERSVHRLLHPLILTGAANLELILEELARALERLNVNTTSVFDALITEMKDDGVVLDAYNNNSFNFVMKEDIGKAIAYKDEMINRGIEPSLVTYNLLIDALFEVGSTWEGKEMIEEMQETGLKPDVYTYNTLMSGHFKCRDQNFRLYDEMVEKRIQPTVLTYNTMMLVIRRGDMNEAFRVCDEMLKMGFDPTITSYDGLIMDLCFKNEFEHAEELLKEMSGFQSS